MKDDTLNICKELGDVFLHICFYAKIGEEKSAFDIADVCNKLADKLIFRHPHVYHPSQVGASSPKPLPYGEDDKPSDMQNADTAQKVIENWEQIKLKEKDGNKRVLSGVPDALPTLIKAYRIQDKARNVGFDWEDRGDVWKKCVRKCRNWRRNCGRVTRKSLKRTWRFPVQCHQRSPSL